MQLHYLPGACSMADHIVLEWIGKPYQAHAVPRDELKGAFLKINPAGAVPALQDGDWVLTQNVAILNYLADTFPDAGLGGDGSPRGRAEANRWLTFVNADIHPAFKPLFAPDRYITDPAQHDDLKANARRNLRALFEIANRQLDGRDWLAGSRSIADPYLFVVLRWAAALSLDLSGLDNLARFSARMGADAGVRKVMQDEGVA